MEKLILIVGLQHSTSVATQIAKDANNIDFVFGIQLFDAVAQSNETTRSTDARTRRKEMAQDRRRHFGVRLPAVHDYRTRSLVHRG